MTLKQALLKNREVYDRQESQIPKSVAYSGNSDIKPPQSLKAPTAELYAPQPFNVPKADLQMAADMPQFIENMHSLKTGQDISLADELDKAMRIAARRQPRLTPDEELI